MMKKLLQRIIAGYAITLCANLPVHLAVAHLAGTAVVPAFSAMFRTEIAATLAQTMLCGLIGAAFAGASLIFETGRWNYLVLGAVHFAVTAAVWIPVTMLCRWIPSNAAGLACCFGGWLLTYAVNWLVQYFIYRSRIRELNRQIAKMREREEHACN